MELVATQKVMKDYGLCAIKCYKIKGRTGTYEVELLGNGKMRCSCFAGQMNKECRHKRILKNKLKGEKYEHRSKTN